MTRIDQLGNVLAIETAVAGGSVALIRDEMHSVSGREGIGCARAEELIPIISALTDEASIPLRDLTLIAVSRGPGSYSGIRIGLSTALGLGNALGIQCVGVSVLEAMAAAADLTGLFVVAIPVGKNDVASQHFFGNGEKDPAAEGGAELLSAGSFIAQLTASPTTTLFAHTELLARVGDQIAGTTDCMDAGNAMAGFVGRLASRRKGTSNSLQPIYLRNLDAAVRSPGL